MGMTIDFAIQRLQAERNDYRHDTVSNWALSLDTAIDTMRKYQMIEEIYKNWCYPTYFNATDAMNKLGEVLKDGNDSW